MPEAVRGRKNKTKMAEIEKVLMTGDNGMSAADFAALSGNNGMNNNPMQWLVWLYAMRWLGNNGENCGIENLRTQISDNQNNNALMNQLTGNAAAMQNIANQTNTNIDFVRQSCCNLNSAIAGLSGEVGISGERIINGVLLGNKDLTQALQNCCCNMQKEVLTMNYENRLAAQQNTSGILGRIDQLANGIQGGFAQVGYAAAQNTNAIMQNDNANTQRIVDTLNSHWTQELQLKYQDAKGELSQIAQTSALTAQLNAIAAAIAKIPTT